MTIQLTANALRAIFPKAPQDILDAFLEKQDVLTRSGINHTRPRLNYFLANVEHESGGFSIKNLTENINYTHERLAQVFPNRVASAAAARMKYGVGPGWQLRAFDDLYGNRMGNRPGTNDGSRHIGRGGPQWTGRDGYEQCEKRTGLPCVSNPEVVARHDVQPEIGAAFWDWKKLNTKADLGDFLGCVKLWNGGTNGLADRKALMAGNDPIVARLANVDALAPIIKDLPGGPPTPAPPPEVIDEATKAERTARAGAVVAGAVTGGNETAKHTTGTVSNPVAHSFVSYAAIGAFVAIAVIATILIARKRAAIAANWF